MLVLSISGEISAQEKRDSVRIYFHQGKVNIDTCLLDNGNEMERFAKICSALNDSVRLIRKIQIIGGASPEGGGLLNGRLSEKRAEVLWRYISPYIKIPVLEKDFHFSGSDWNGLITMVRADVNVPEREDVLRLLEKIVRLENQDSPYLGGELKRLKGGRPYSYLYKFHFPKLRSSMVKICYDSDPINPVRDTVYIHTRDTLCIRDTVTVIAPVKKRPFCMAVKTNLLYDAVLIPDIGVEFCLGKNWSVITVVQGKFIEVNSNTTATDISEKTPMLNIPQKLTAWKVSEEATNTKIKADGAHQCYLSITCKIQQSGGYLLGSADSYGTIYVPFGDTWVAGKRHIYTLIFGGGYTDQGEAVLNPIQFDAETTGWVDANSNVNVKP